LGVGVGCRVAGVAHEGLRAAALTHELTTRSFDVLVGQVHKLQQFAKQDGKPTLNAYQVGKERRRWERWRWERW